MRKCNPHTPSGTTRLGTQGNDNMIGTEGPDRMYGLGGDDLLFGLGGNDWLYGGAGNDRLEGADGNDRLFGGAGNDRFEGGSGNDWMEGGAGDDDFIMWTEFGVFGVIPGNDSIHGGAGRDSVSFAISDVSSTHAVTVDLARGTWSTPDSHGRISGIEVVGGSVENDRLLGSCRAESLFGDAGDDFIDGRGGDDRLHGDADSDTILGGRGNDLLIGDLPPGEGGAGNDLLKGGAGNDTLWGGLANDTLVGGPGADDFVFERSGPVLAGDFAVAHIADFTPGKDELVFHNSGRYRDIGEPGDWGACDPRFYAAAGATAAHDATDRLIYDTSTGSLYYDSDGTGSTEAELIAILSGEPRLSAGDISVTAQTVWA